MAARKKAAKKAGRKKSAKKVTRKKASKKTVGRKKATGKRRVVRKDSRRSRGKSGGSAG